MAQAEFTIGDAFREATERQKSGRLSGAETLYRAILREQPNHPGANHNLGLIALKAGRFGDGLELIGSAVASEPEIAEFHNSLGEAYRGLGRYEEALAAFDRALALKPGLTFAASNRALVLGEIGRALMRAGQTEGGLEALYAGKAATWDALDGYQAAAAVAATIERASAVLDLGCGTGLVGEHVRPRVERLVGVDLSAAMLERAKAKGVYDDLHQADLLSFLERDGCYDAVTCAATLIHFGDVGPAFRAVASRLRGLFALSLFEGAGGFGPHPQARYAANGIYAHGRDYIASAATAAGFTVQDIRTDVHERDAHGNPIEGLVVTLRR